MHRLIYDCSESEILAQFHFLKRTQPPINYFFIILVLNLLSTVNETNDIEPSGVASEVVKLGEDAGERRQAMKTDGV